jgi:hypothetical protein
MLGDGAKNAIENNMLSYFILFIEPLAMTGCHSYTPRKFARES